MRSRSHLIITSAWHWLIRLSQVLISQAFIAALCLFLYSGFLTWFYYRLKVEVMTELVKTYGCEAIDQCLIDRWRFSIFAFGVIYITIFRWIGVNNWIAKQFILASEIVFVLTLAIILTNYFLILAEPYTSMIVIDLGTALATLMIIINATVYGFHRND